MKLVVKDKSFRKHGLVNEFFGIGEISNMFFSVAVAGQNNRKLIFLTEIQDSGCIGSCVSPISSG
ncbi:hypothetical protein L0P56_19230, partial [Anaerosalibacter bizertensis]|nr:hypothetical protein [Anaerosalibacter bizertensis]